jgi:hypothetical protein
MRKLRQDRFDPKNLEALEQRRWECILKYRALLKGSWREMLEMFPKDGNVYGHYSGRLVCFEYDGYGISHNFPEEFSTYQIEFVRCLTDKELSLYINSTSETVKQAVNKRLEGDPTFSPYELREDIVQCYYKIERKNFLFLKAIGLYEEIIKQHFQNILHRMVSTHKFDRPIISLILNGRTYTFKDDKFLIKPETYNPKFTVQDLMSNTPVEESYLSIPSNNSLCTDDCTRYKKALEALNCSTVSKAHRVIIHEALYPTNM